MNVTIRVLTDEGCWVAYDLVMYHGDTCTLRTKDEPPVEFLTIQIHLDERLADHPRSFRL
jgi:hypothetical protein